MEKNLPEIASIGGQSFSILHPLEMAMDFTGRRNETKADNHIRIGMDYFCPCHFPVCVTLWRNVGRTLDKDISQEERQTSAKPTCRQVMTRTLYGHAAVMLVAFLEK